jgi:hypothetical protein
MFDVECSRTCNFDVWGALLFFKGKNMLSWGGGGDVMKLAYFIIVLNLGLYELSAF